MTHTLVVRLDSVGDVLLTGPAIRAQAAVSDRVTLLCGPRGRSAAELLPGVDAVHTWAAPWIERPADPVSAAAIEQIQQLVEELAPDRAVIFTSFHQSALPTALVLRMAGVPWIGALSEDYPGSLLDLRLAPDWSLHEVQAMLRLSVACGGRLAGEDHLEVRGLPRRPTGLPRRYVVLHPGASAPASQWSPDRFGRVAAALSARGVDVVVTGTPAERTLTAVVAGSNAIDLGGCTDLATLGAVIKGARAMVVANTGPAHLAAAVGTPIVSLFSPSVPAERWAPWRVPTVLLGDQSAPCRGTRAVACSRPGHPCLDSVSPDDVVDALIPFLTADEGEHP